MRILVVGSGGREHALAWKLGQEAEVVVAPGNPGIAREFECVPVPPSDSTGLSDFCKVRGIDLVVIGPEIPLIDGLADRLRGAGTPVYGPGADGAQHEGSKAFSKDLMRKAGVPTAAFGTFHDCGEACRYADESYAKGLQLVVKASGAAMGKGVLLPPDLEAVKEAIEDLMLRRALEEAGQTVVLEQRLIGREFSLMSVCSGTSFVSLPVAQDYKRIGTGDTGPNTGGMGSVCPAEWVTPELVAKTEQRIVAPMLRAMAELGIAYRGTLFTGAMVVEGEPYCIEYNVRFGDPEAQSIFSVLGPGFAEMLLAAAAGNALPPPSVAHGAAVSVVVASEGYPGPYRKGDPIELPVFNSNQRVFFAGVAETEGRLVSHGGRVLCVTGTGPNVEGARAAAYSGVQGVRFEGMHYRADIAG